MKRILNRVEFENEKLVQIKKLRFDQKNNRLLHLEHMANEELEKTLWKEAKLSSLYYDIMKRGLQDPLILYPNSHTVAEGNCRLACLKKLCEEALTSTESTLNKFKNQKVSCKQITNDVTKSEIDAYLTEIHVGRKKKWPEYNQAHLLHKLKYKDNLSLEEIANISRSSRPTVTKKIAAYELTKTYHERYPNDDAYVKKFYYFWEFSHTDLIKFKDDDRYKQKFMKWVYFGKFANSKLVRYLPKLMDNRKAFKKFEESDMDKALKILHKSDPTIQNPAYKNISKITTYLSSFDPKVIEQIIEDESKQIMIEQLKVSAEKLLKHIKTLERNRDLN